MPERSTAPTWSSEIREVFEALSSLLVRNTMYTGSDDARAAAERLAEERG
jgi:hypothetical protein